MFKEITVAAEDIRFSRLPLQSASLFDGLTVTTRQWVYPKPIHWGDALRRAREHCVSDARRTFRVENENAQQQKNAFPRRNRMYSQRDSLLCRQRWDLRLRPHEICTYQIRWDFGLTCVLFVSLVVGKIGLLQSRSAIGLGHVGWTSKTERRKRGRDSRAGRYRGVVTRNIYFNIFRRELVNGNG